MAAIEVEAVSAEIVVTVEAVVEVGEVILEAEGEEMVDSAETEAAVFVVIEVVGSEAIEEVDFAEIEVAAFEATEAVDFAVEEAAMVDRLVVVNNPSRSSRKPQSRNSVY